MQDVEAALRRMKLPMAAAQETAQMESVSILNIIVNIVPDNIVTAFQNADMLQVIFIAVLCGIAVGAIGEQGKVLRDIFNACNELFLRITRMIISLVPVATFCAITSLVATTGLEMLKMLASLVGTILLGLIVLTLAISVMMLAIGAPGVTGAAFICLSTLVVQLGIPVEAVTILMGIDQLMSMLRTTANSTGDAVGALVVAKSEKMLDVDMYRSK